MSRLTIQNVIHNDYGQIAVRGELVLKEDHLLASPRMERFHKAAMSITVKKGDVVRYEFKETRSGNYHSISLSKDGREYSKGYYTDVNPFEYLK